MSRNDRFFAGLAVAGLFGFGACAHTASTDEYNTGATEAIHAKSSEFERCYAIFGNGKPIESWIEFSANFDGAVQFAEIAESEIHVSNPKFDECALKVFRTIQFPEADPNARAASGKYPIRFQGWNSR
ncbi:MAG: hypothetical protein JST04_15860 [Bdellovibrionales bacterium]|nr:hypothetical protein [Bdellovibrionales bacterium]